VMASDAAPADIDSVVTIVESAGAEALVSRGVTELFDNGTDSV